MQGRPTFFGPESSKKRVNFSWILFHFLGLESFKKRVIFKDFSGICVHNIGRNLAELLGMLVHNFWSNRQSRPTFFGPKSSKKRVNFSWIFLNFGGNFCLLWCPGNGCKTGV